MANLPNRPFMFNYNARDYDPATYTFPKESGQLFDHDLVLALQTGSGPVINADGSLSFSYHPCFMGYDWSGTETGNPFNRDSSHSTFTFIYKTKYYNSPSTNIFANRDEGTWNYMVRGDFFHDGNQQLNFAPTTDPQIIFIRVDEYGNGERKEVDADGNVITAATGEVSYGDLTSGNAFFAGYEGGGEFFDADFYWMYCSMETLTDAEIQQVIAYNENLSSIAASPTAITASYSGITTSVTLTTDSGVSWTATTVPAWVTLSSTAGTDTTTIYVNIMKNNSNIARTGSIVFTNENDDTAEVLCTQEKHPLLVPVGKLYREGQLID